MNSLLKKQAAALAELSAADRARLEKLAELAGSDVEETWSSVYLYGFDDMEESIKAWLDAEADIAAGRTVPHEEVMSQAMQILTQHGQRKRKAG